METRHARDVFGIVHLVGIEDAMRWIVPGHEPTDGESPFNHACETAKLVKLTEPLSCLVCIARAEVHFRGYYASTR